MIKDSPILKNQRSKMIARLQDKGIKSELVLRAMSEIPRHVFVEPAFVNRAYDDDALPLGRGQTISKPLVVAMMTELCAAVNPQKVLEIGSGCGYQTAILSRITRKVISIERIKSLMELSSSNLRNIGITNVQVYHGDGHLGLSTFAPYDAILVSAAVRTVPENLFNQLALGGRMVIPMESINGAEQSLFVFDKTPSEVKILNYPITPFVPMLEGKIA